jgi:TolB-like protein/DNA-binding winged helix-turn-helix (wHTH) protein/Tfp pilus assembly protein PilF
MSESQYRFAEFQLDCASFELRRQGRAQKSERISLERIPLELLILLLERQGSVVTRQEIVDRLWGKDVFVDTEHGINTAIRKVRQALKDDPDQPRFIQTVSGKGYRFVAETNARPSGSARTEAPRSMERTAPRPHESPEPRWRQPSRKPARSEVEGAGGAEVSRRPGAIENAVPESASTKTKMIAVVAICLTATAALTFLFRARIFPSTQAAQIHSLAVIPLANLSGDPSQDYFADGMTDELITALARNRTLSVVSRTSAMQYKGVNRPVRDIARELGVDGILEGSIERTANHVHMTVQLIYAPTDSHVWAESYDRDLDQAYSLPEELSRIVAKEVKAATSPPPALRYINPEAHDAYLHGRYFWFAVDIDQSQQEFEKAIQLQPDYAAAWSGLADAYGLRAVYGLSPGSEAVTKMESAARKAVELDDSSAEAHNSLSAWYFFFAWDPQRALAEADRALALGSAQSHFLRAHALIALHRTDEAIQEEKRFVELDPLVFPWALGLAYLNLGQIDNAIAELRLRTQVQPNDFVSHYALAEAYWLKRMWPEFAQQIEKEIALTESREKAAEIHQAYERGGYKAVSQKRLEFLQARSRKMYVSPIDFAYQYAFLNDKEQTLKSLEDSFRDRSPAMAFLQNEPLFNFVHDDPRYQALAKKMGIVPIS